MSAPSVHDFIDGTSVPAPAVVGDRHAEILRVVVAGAHYLRAYAPAYRRLLAASSSDERRADARRAAIELAAVLQRAHRDEAGLRILARTPFDPGGLFGAIGQMQASLAIIADPVNGRYAPELAIAPADVEGVLASDEVQRLLDPERLGDSEPA